MDRIHRLGQHRPVHAIKLVIEDSLESRIVQLQEKKSAMVDATLSNDDSAMGRLTAEDLGKDFVRSAALIFSLLTTVVVQDFCSACRIVELQNVPMLRGAN